MISNNSNIYSQKYWAKEDTANKEEPTIDRVSAYVFACFKRAADQGCKYTQFSVGKSYMEGKIVKENPLMAIQYFKMAAKQGYVIALYQLGYLYKNGVEDQEGNLLIISHTRAVKFYKICIEKDKNHSNALFDLAMCYKNGEGCYRDLKVARDYFHRAVLEGNTDARKYDEELTKEIEKMMDQDHEKEIKTNNTIYSSDFNAKIFETIKDPAQRLDTIKDLLVQGKNPFILLFYYEQYADDLSIELEDPENMEFVNLLRAAVEKYMQINAIEMSKLAIFQHFKQLAKQGNEKALYEVGRLYETGLKDEQGNIIEKDNEKAFKYYLQGAKYNDVNALFSLGRCFEQGIGCNPNLNSANYYYQLADERSIANSNSFNFVKYY